MIPEKRFSIPENLLYNSTAHGLLHFFHYRNFSCFGRVRGKGFFNE